jgi:hypothetical protein
VQVFDSYSPKECQSANVDRHLGYGDSRITPIAKALDCRVSGASILCPTGFEIGGGNGREMVPDHELLNYAAALTGVDRGKAQSLSEVIVSDRHPLSPT